MIWTIRKKKGNEAAGSGAGAGTQSYITGSRRKVVAAPQAEAAQLY